MNDFKKMLAPLISGELMRTPLLREKHYDEITKTPLSIDFDNNFHLVDIYKKSKSEEARRKIVRCIFQLADVIAKHLTITTIAEITNENWITLLDQVKKPSLQYHSDLNERYKIAFRTMGAIITQVKQDGFYREYAKVKRITESRLHSLGHYLFTPNKEKWQNLFKSWIDEVLHVKSSKQHRQAYLYFLNYLSKFDETDIDPLVFLSKQRSKEAMAHFKKEYPNSYRTHLSHLYRFTQWIIEEYMSERDDEGVLFSIGYSLITTYQYEQLAGATKAKGRTESAQIRIPTSYLITIREILTEDDFAWPKSLSTQYFNWLNPGTNQLQSTWSPVYTYVFLTMIEIPIRKIQVQMLDSGEGDDQRYNPRSNKWETNTSPHKGYWNAIQAVRPNRGAITKITEGFSENVGFYINTNKTADIAVGFGPESGYVIPWNNVILIKLLDELRTWQEKHFPVPSPLSYRDIVAGATADSTPSKSVLEQVPDRFYLFRCPRTSLKGSPATNNSLMRFWWALMDKLEQRLHEQGEDVKIVLKTNEKTNQVDKTLFNPHGLRVAGLTSLAEAGVPIEVLSKIIAGHASILMTIYYIKYGDGYITETLNKAKRQVEDNAKNDLKNWLKDATYEEAKRYMVANCETGLITLLEDKALSAVWGGSSLGICPFGGTRCNDGGPLIKKESKTTKAKFGPVVGGQGNCMQCRHFVTGLPWLIDLWLHGNKLLEEITFKSKVLADLQAKQAVLTKKRYSFVKSKQSHLITPELVMKIKNLDALIETKSEQLEVTNNNAHATYNYVNRVKNLKPLGSADKLPDMSVGQLTDIHDNGLAINFVDTTAFHVQNVLVQASRAYPEVEDTRVEMERDHFVDQILVNNGLPPLTFSPLTKEEKRASSDALANLLLSKVGAAECDNLNNGTKTLSDFNIDNAVALSLESIKEGSPELTVELE
jgi:hypothetical protein